MFAHGSFRIIDSENKFTERRVSLGLFRVGKMRSDTQNLKELGYKFLTVSRDRVAGYGHAKTRPEPDIWI